MLPLDERAAAGLHQRMKFKLKKLHAFAIGFPFGLLSFAVLREIVWAFQARPADEVIGDAMSEVGRLGWIDTTLVTGLAAVTAAYVSVRAVRDQIAQVDRIEADRRDASCAATRAMLQLSLSSLCDYATKCARLSYDLSWKFNGSNMADGQKIPEYPSVPDGALTVIKEMIEVVDRAHRPTFAKLVSAIQINAATLRGMKQDFDDGRHSPRLIDVDGCVVASAEVYARSHALFDYSRWDEETVPAIGIGKQEIRGALNLMGLRGFEELAAERRRSGY